MGSQKTLTNCLNNALLEEQIIGLILSQLKPIRLGVFWQKTQDQRAVLSYQTNSNIECA